MTLNEAAAAAGMVDLDLLKAAKPGLHAEAAVADLQRRYPAGFPKPKRYADMSPAERTAFDKAHRIPTRISR